MNEGDSGLAAAAAESVGEDEHLIREAEKIAAALGRMFPGLCEVVLHDLRDPRHAIRAIENNLSGRAVGDSVTELGLARIEDPGYPSVIQNYPNKFPDGRPAKSTSIGIKNAAGQYIAALCLNLDVSVLSPVTLTLSNLVATDAITGSDTGSGIDSGSGHRERPLETLRDRSARELRRAVEALAAERGSTPRSLGREDKKAVVRRLHQDGHFDSRDAAQAIGDLLGVSRATVYNYVKHGGME